MLDNPMPQPNTKQRIAGELDALQPEADALKCLQAESVAELDALLPGHSGQGI
jgi:hypothetical protein